MVKYIVSVVIVLSLLGCDNKKEKASFRLLSISNHHFKNLSIENIAHTVDPVLLEITDSSLIGNILKIERTDKYLFILDFNGPKVLQFDLNGNFIKEMGKRGNGPEEYSNLLTFTIDEESDHIYLATLRKVVRYDFENNFIDYFSGLTFPEYVNFNDGLLEVYLTKNDPQTNGTGFVKKSLRYRIQDNKSVLDSIITKEINLKQQVYTTYPKTKYLSSSSQSNFFYQPVLIPEDIIRDTLYEIKNNEFLFYLKLEFGSIAIDEKGTKAVNIKSITKSDRFLFAEYLYGGRDRVFVYDFKEEKGYNLENGINGGEYSENEPIELFPLVNEPNTYYFNTRVASDLSDYEPNPTVFFIQLKR